MRKIEQLQKDRESICGEIVNDESVTYVQLREMNVDGSYNLFSLKNYKA